MKRAKSAIILLIAFGALLIPSDAHALAHVGVSQQYSPGFTSVGVCVNSSSIWTTGSPNQLDNSVSMWAEPRICMNGQYAGVSITARVQVLYWNTNYNQWIVYCDKQANSVGTFFTVRASVNGSCPWLFPGTLVMMVSYVQGNFEPYTWWTSGYSHIAMSS